MTPSAVESGYGLTLTQCATEIAFCRCAVKENWLESTDGIKQPLVSRVLGARKFAHVSSFNPHNTPLVRSL